MSQISFRANLANDDIPLLSAFMGRTVIVGRIDQDYELEVNTTNKLQKEKQIPQAYFAQNIMPTGQGYQSVGFAEQIAAMASTPGNFGETFILRDPDENKFLYAPAGGNNYIFNKNVNEWVSISPIDGGFAGLVTVAYIGGETYIYFQKVGCFKYNITTNLLEEVTLIALVKTEINGICSSNGFLLAWDDDNFVYRSQSATPLDFTPDQSLGSGAGVPEDIRGKIVILLPIANGFMVYTTANCVAAVFQQNIRYPFIFREVEGSSGIISARHVSWQDNLGEHYAWTISGLQKLNKSKAIPIFPECTDFLVAKKFEDFDYATNTLTVQSLDQQLNVAITAVGSRFVIISYGIDSFIFTHAIVYDLAYKRFGKLKKSHVDVFTYAVPNLAGDLSWDDLSDFSWDDFGEAAWQDFEDGLMTAETPKEIIAFINENGQIDTVTFSLSDIGEEGVVVLGKYQFVRERLLELDAIILENIEQGNNFELLHWISTNGKTTAYQRNPFLVASSDQYRRYHTVPPYKTGINHSILAKGTFHLTTLQLEFHVGPRR